MSRTKKLLLGSLMLVIGAAGARAAGEGLDELLEEQSQIESAKTKLVAQGDQLKDYRRQADQERAKLESEAADLDRRVTEFNQVAAPVFAEVDRWNGQCGGRELPEAEYNSCLSWRSQIEPQLNEVNAQRGTLESAANDYKQRAGTYEAAEQELSRQEQDWANQVQDVDRQDREWHQRAAAWRVQQITELAQRCGDSTDPDAQVQCLDRLFDGRAPAQVCSQEDLRAFAACLAPYVARTRS